MKSLSTSIAFIILLFFTANVAGAEEVKSELDPNGYTLGFKEQPACGGWCADGFVQAKDSCDCVKEQSEPEPKLLPLGGRWLDANGNCLKAFDKDGKTIPCERPEDEEIPCTLYKSGLTVCDEDKMKKKIESEKSDAEKWREKCEAATEACSNGYFNSCTRATAYCTRFNGALLEEIKEKIK